MTKFQKLLDHPLVIYLVIGTFSIVAAFLFWKIGGNFARVLSAEPILGVSLELGGAIAGFVSVFIISLLVFKQLHKLLCKESPLRNIKVFLIPRDQFPMNETYSCKVSIYDDEEGEERTDTVIPHRENGYLTIDLRDLRDHDRYRIIITNSAKQEWQSEYCPLAAPKAEMQAI